MKKVPVFKIIFILVLFAVVLIAIVQNLSMATVKFLFFGVSAPIIAVILISLFFGFLIGLLTSSLLAARSAGSTKSNENTMNPSPKQKS